MAMAATDVKQQAQLFEKFITDKKILVADANGASRASIANILTQMGAKSPQVTLIDNFVDAEKAIETIQPNVLIADYDLKKYCGLDLLQKQRSCNPKSKESLFVLVTGNTSQGAVARAAEEDVDTFVIKPFTSGVFKASIAKAALLKFDPPEYVKVIERGKLELANGQIDEAYKTFEYAKTLDRAPALSCYYLGQIEDIKKSADTAQKNYATGLQHNKIHYKCLVGLYENLMSRKLHKEAYEVIKKISQYFPANPQRLTAVLRLAVVTQSYEDVERYYRVFSNLEERNEEMIKYVCASLVVCGKHYLNQGHGIRAHELFQKAANTASGRTRILREIISALIEVGNAKQADEFLKRFPASTHATPDYQAMHLLVMEHTSPRGLVLEKGREMLEKDIHDPVIYRILIKLSAEAGNPAAADSFLQAGLKKFPDSKAMLEKVLPATKETPAAPVAKA